jgi:acetyl-CoA synthetase
MFRGYFKAEQTYRSKFVGGYYLTGDRGSVDSDGYYWFVGRDDDVINTAGHLVGPFEVESALLRHPAVAESAAVSKPDPTYGEVVKSFIVLRPGHPGSDEFRAQASFTLGHAACHRFRGPAPQDPQWQDPAPHAARPGMG